MRRVLSLLSVLTLLALILAGCGGQPSQQAAQPASSPAPAAPAAAPAKSDYHATEQAKKVLEIAGYQGADKLQKLAEGAKANNEKELNFYTSINLDESVPILDDFEGWLDDNFGLSVNVNLWRANSEKVLQRAVIEAQAGRFDVDIFETNGPELEVLRREKITAPFWVPAFDDYPAEARDPDGYWHATRFNFFVQAWNTDLISQDELPKTYQDLLDPKWKGNLGLEASDWDWFATLVKQGPFGGQEQAMAYFNQLRAQDLQVRDGHTLLVNLVTAGEIPYAITVYNHRVERDKKKGAPIDWYVLEPAVARPNGTGIAANAPNPHLALLFVEYMLAKEGGQAMLLKLDRVPANPQLDTNLNKGFRYVMADVTAIIDEAKQWQETWDKTLIQK